MNRLRVSRDPHAMRHTKQLLSNIFDSPLLFPLLECLLQTLPTFVSESNSFMSELFVWNLNNGTALPFLPQTKPITTSQERLIACPLFRSFCQKLVSSDYSYARTMLTFGISLLRIPTCSAFGC
uniref:Uncharacterized protein n=1 Tax=Schistocephalus solidus TaxID=70667 RepID=A0A0V0J3F9_SCHSO